MSRPRRSELPAIRARGRYWPLAGALAAAAAVAVLATVAVLVDDTPPVEEAPSALPEVAVVADPGDEAAEDDAAAEEAVPTPMVTTDIFLARDPFDPVVPEDEPEDPADPEEPAAPADPADPAPPADPDDPADPANENTQPRPDRPGDDPCYGDDELVCNGEVLTLVGTEGTGDDRVAEIQVGDTRYRVQPGDRFGNYELGEFSNGCVWIVIGDVSQRLCPEGQLLK